MYIGMAYELYIQSYKHNAVRGTVKDALTIVYKMGTTKCEVHAGTRSPNIPKAFWYRAIEFDARASDPNLDLYQQCKAVRRKRDCWRSFQKTFVYVEPSVPPLPT